MFKDLAIRLAYDAGRIMRKNFQHNMAKDWKQDNTPVTATDLAINQLVLDEIGHHFPEHSVLAEEGSNLKSSEYVWVCDPVDGTTAFSHAIPTCVFSLALVHQGKSILSVIYDPFLDRLFFAEKDQGAWLNQQRIYVNKHKALDHTLIGIVPSRRYQGLILEVLKFCREHNVHVVSLGSTIYMGMLVASGDLTASIFCGQKAHDSAALKILIDEAGGTMTDIQGQDQRYDQEVNGHIISNAALHEPFLNLMNTITGNREQ